MPEKSLPSHAVEVIRLSCLTRVSPLTLKMLLPSHLDSPFRLRAEIPLRSHACMLGSTQEIATQRREESEPGLALRPDLQGFSDQPPGPVQESKPQRPLGQASNMEDFPPGVSGDVLEKLHPSQPVAVDANTVDTGVLGLQSILKRLVV